MNGHIKEVVSKAIDHILDRNYLEYVNLSFELIFYANSNLYNSRKHLLKIEFCHSESQGPFESDFFFKFKLKFSQKDDLHRFENSIKNKLKYLEITDDNIGLYIKGSNVLWGWISCAPDVMKELISTFFLMYNQEWKGEKIFIIINKRDDYFNYEPLAFIS